MRAIQTLAAALLAGAALAAPAAARDRPDPMELLAQSDANRDGAISRAEFIDARRARFAKMDRNDDGYFSDDDLPRIVRKRAGDKLDRAMQSLDENRDRRLSRAEFVNGPARLFDFGDKNGDGVIDRGEMDRLRTVIAARRG
ncbi:MAG: EF-hand domain-containing protein [Phenylobacterium sp.]|uniref:EF-hand domain-containing protein n=1 Tax=Phenylobacterium sp. TaxID=1871053 RepID=UPI0011FC43D1|nr:EF-hand domain-containing protein [Phenylobacterium sp.]TAJ71317.1 MAG: EF-hand domain-containing protein [Phenylobacterium sp.]